VTTIDAAAAWRAEKTVRMAVVAALLGLSLGGCESTGGGLFGMTPDGVKATSVAAAPNTAAIGQSAKIAIAPIIGAPDRVAKQLQMQLGAAIEQKQVTVAKAPNQAAKYTVRGYVVSAREKSATKVSYIWDVTDTTGKRVNRITGEEVISGGTGRDPWASVTPQIVKAISNKTATSLVTWLPTQSSAAVAAGAPAGNTQASSSMAHSIKTAAGSPAAAYPAAAKKTASTSKAPKGTTTGSINRVNAMVPSVVGAPGDGSVALTSALQRELARSGIALTNRPTGLTYRVEGKVAVGQGNGGRQPIQIDWNVKDPKGKNLGTVSQKNDIPQGSLDGAWGKTADAAAAAAAQGILKLLPKPTKTN
jgi:hypothetical protein